MIMRGGVVVSVGLTLALVLAACAERDYVRPNTTREQFQKDVADCQRQVDAVVARDRAIDQDINATLGAQQRSMSQGRDELRQQMSTRGEATRTQHLMEQCLRGRGYTPASEAPPQPKDSKEKKQ